MYFHYFATKSPLEIFKFRQCIFDISLLSRLGKGRTWPFIWTNLNTLYPKMLCVKFGWSWSSGSGEEDENVKKKIHLYDKDANDDGQRKISSLEALAQISLKTSPLPLSPIVVRKRAGFNQTATVGNKMLQFPDWWWVPTKGTAPIRSHCLFILTTWCPLQPEFRLGISMGLFRWQPKTNTNDILMRRREAADYVAIFFSQHVHLSKTCSSPGYKELFEQLLVS